ncbi:MAG: hypothetical protein M1115_09455 [Actinobacteria bacterium]|nr:hypothetical protein [Actinomycetota bacterium]
MPQSIVETDGSLGFVDVYCTSTSSCMAVDDGAGVNGDLAFTYRGPAAFIWSGSSSSESNVLNAGPPVSCASSDFCMSLGGGDAYTYSTPRHRPLSWVLRTAASHVIRAGTRQLLSLH